MKISREWLRDHIDLDDMTTSDLANMLTFAGVEVEEIEENAIHEKVVAAEVTHKEQHPDADKLSICKVAHGDGTSQIVCGANNFSVGDKVPLALPGAKLGELKIKKGKLRGVTSEGMLCSGSELGLPTDVDGLLILDPTVKPGTRLRELYAADTVLTVEVTPNRPDWLSHLGIGRELAALSSKRLKTPAIVGNDGTKTRVANDAEIHLDEGAACPFYTARLIRGIKVGPSPDWLQNRLAAIGLRPINNIVDITNYVLMEMGQPLHAFDASHLEGGIHVRCAKDREKLVALDGETYELTPSDTVIADSKKAVAIAGVMGGGHSGVTEATTDILLESAYFLPASIRRTSHRLTLSSDSSYRFERGVDPQQVLGASLMATNMILELAGGEAESEIAVAGRAPELVSDVEFENDRCRKLLGVDISDTEIHKILTGLGLEAVPGKREGSKSNWKIPSYRIDLLRPVDLAEEVARVFGLDNIPASVLALTALPSKDDDVYDVTLRLKNHLVTLGFCESPTLSMVSAGQNRDAATGTSRDPVRIKNPLGTDYGLLRTSLLSGLALNELASGLLNVASRNANLGAPSSRLFEVGQVYAADGEETHVAILMAGEAEPVSWISNRPRSLNIHDLQGVLESLLPNATLDLELIDDDPALPLAANINVRLSGNRTHLGQLGCCSPTVSRKIGYEHVLVAELRMRIIEKLLSGVPTFSDISPYPSIKRDLAMEIDATVSCKTVEDFFRGYREELLESFALFDVFSDPSGEKLDTTKKSLAYSLTYRAKNKTLKSEVVDKTHAKLLKVLQEQLGVTMR